MVQSGQYVICRLMAGGGQGRPNADMEEIEGE